ncbi:MAG: FAD:protein FMN transferase [Acidimicrobiales bacterium]
MISRAESVMGTVVSFLVDPGALPEKGVDRLIDDACAELHRLDERFSTWKPESELSRWRRGGAAAPSSLMSEVLELSHTARRVTKGFFDPWALPGGFDPTGLVKGWAAERALAILAHGGLTTALVNAGGDVCVLPGTSFDVGVQHPRDPDALCGVVRVTSAVATSGVYARGDHLVNPFGGEVVAVSATVIGGRLAYADALATALAVGGVPVLHLLERRRGVEGFFITPDGTLYQTSGMTFVNAAPGEGEPEPRESGPTL